MNKIYYSKGYKYQLKKDYIIKVNIIGYSVDIQFIKLTPDGILLIRSGYAWDGASGPTLDDETNMRGSLVHDALYQLMRMELISLMNRQYTDDLLKSICIEDGMSEFRAEYWHIGVDLFAEGAADPKNKKKIYVAP